MTACCILGSSALGCGDDGAADPLVVSLTDGDVRGTREGSSLRFLKIPYAKPPVGALRWKAPEPNDPWRGERAETAFASACPQQANNQGPASYDEDCLYLNVWRPDPKPSKAPVMVWIHGGGNFAGSAGDKVPDPLANPADLPLFYDGREFAARHGVVVVTGNYRLGPFGFFSHPALSAEGGALANQGLLDQRAMLRWVQRNIAAFGGDPDNVTLFGESAGSADVCYHVASPQSRGLFHRAISQSGGCLASPRSTPDNSLSQSAAPMRAFAAALGCADDTNALSCLRGKSVQEILDNGMQPDPTGGFFAEPAWSFQPVVDGTGGFLPEPAQALYARGDIADVPYLLGSNNDEGSLFTLSTMLRDEGGYRDALERAFGDAADDVFEAYPPSRFDDNYNAAYARVVGDSGLVCGTHAVAQQAAKAGRRVFMYNFNVPWSVGFGTLGAAHGSEISHVFGTPYKADAASTAVSDAMNAYWASFARNGDPNFEGAPATWPRFSTDRDERLELAPSWTVLRDFRAAECAFWAELRARTSTP